MSRLMSNTMRTVSSLFVSVGLCFVVEALWIFFKWLIQNKNQQQMVGVVFQHLTEVYQKSYVNNILDKFLDKYVYWQ